MGVYLFLGTLCRLTDIDIETPGNRGLTFKR